MDIGKLLAILTRLHGDVDFTNREGLVDDGVLDSFDIVSLVAEIGDAFDVRIPPEEITPDNFNSADALFAMIRRLMEE